MFRVTYHPKVREDLRNIHRRHVAVIRDAIESKLVTDPEGYGKPLRNTLMNLRSLRIGNYRIVYAVRKKKLIVLVLTVAGRDKVYRAAGRRIKQG